MCSTWSDLLTLQTERLPMLHKNSRIKFDSTETAHRGFSHLSGLSDEVLHCEGLYLENGDVARETGWVMYMSASDDTPQIGQVAEILLRATDGGALGFLITKGSVGEEELPYRLPRVHLHPNHYEFVAKSVSVCIHEDNDVLTNGHASCRM